MKSLDPKQQIIIRRSKRVRKLEHHGGAWKVAMADFALAMMALFIVLWIISNTDQAEKEAISGYFQDPLAYQEGRRIPSDSAIDLGGTPSVFEHVAGDPDASLAELSLDSVEHRLQDEIESSDVLSPFRNQLLVDITSEGVRLQLVDQTDRPMFGRGSAKLRYYAEDILWELGPVLAQFERGVSIAGHTDASKASNTRDENDVNWLLSASRADAARRALMEAGVKKRLIAAVMGLGDTVPLDKQNPRAATNRRISITLLKRSGERADDTTQTMVDEAVLRADGNFAAP